MMPPRFRLLSHLACVDAAASNPSRCRDNGHDRGARRPGGGSYRDPERRAKTKTLWSHGVRFSISVLSQEIG